MADAPWTPAPWLPYMATRYIAEYLEEQMRPLKVFEWGSGGSTLFFARLGIEFLVSIEHDREWWEKVNGALPERYILDYRLIPYEEGEIGPDKGNPAHYKSGSTELGPVNFKKYASVIDEYGKFDLILIDGMARASCLYHAISHVKEGGCIVLDNVGDRPYYLAQTDYLFGNYEDGWERIQFSGYGPILAYQWSTLILKNTRKSDYG
jgi:hypothetical protein